MGEMRESIFQAVRDARRKKGWTQSKMAAEIAAKQPAISSYERGHSDALSESKIRLLAEKLGLDLAAYAEKQVQAGPRVAKYCPEQDCRSNLPDVQGERVFFQPVLQSGPEDEDTRCRFCGEVLETRCPNAECNEPVRPGRNCCTKCSTPYVPTMDAGPGRDEKWSDDKRRRFLELLELGKVQL